MPHGHDAGSGGAGFIGGLFEGFGAGSNFRRDRDDRRRQDQERADERTERERRRQLQEALLRAEHGIEFTEPGTPTGPTDTGADLAGRVARFRAGVGQQLLEPTAAGGASPLAMGQDTTRTPLTAEPDLGAGFRPTETLGFTEGGFQKTGPSAAERRQAEAQALNERVGRQLAGLLGVPEDRGIALHQTGLGDDAFRAANQEDRPVSHQALTTADGLFSFNPRTRETAPITGPGGRQLRGRPREFETEGGGSRRGPRSPEAAASSLYQEAQKMIRQGLSTTDIANWSLRDDQPFKRHMSREQRIATIERAAADLGPSQARQQWDQMALEARRQGLDPEMAIGFPRP
jgi:hypothetical protein